MRYARRDLGRFSLSDDFVALSINLRYLMAVVPHLQYLTEHYVILLLSLTLLDSNSNRVSWPMQTTITCSLSHIEKVLPFFKKERV